MDGYPLALSALWLGVPVVSCRFSAAAQTASVANKAMEPTPVNVIPQRGTSTEPAPFTSVAHL